MISPFFATLPHPSTPPSPSETQTRDTKLVTQYIHPVQQRHPVQSSGGTLPSPRHGSRYRPDRGNFVYFCWRLARCLSYFLAVTALAAAADAQREGARAARPAAQISRARPPPPPDGRWPANQKSDRAADKNQPNRASAGGRDVKPSAVYRESHSTADLAAIAPH